MLPGRRVRLRPTWFIDLFVCVFGYWLDLGREVCVTLGSSSFFAVTLIYILNVNRYYL